MHGGAADFENQLENQPPYLHEDANDIQRGGFMRENTRRDVDASRSSARSSRASPAGGSGGGFELVSGSVPPRASYSHQRAAPPPPRRSYAYGDDADEESFEAHATTSNARHDAGAAAAPHSDPPHDGDESAAVTPALLRARALVSLYRGMAGLDSAGGDAGHMNHDDYDEEWGRGGAPPPPPPALSYPYYARRDEPPHHDLRPALQLSGMTMGASSPSYAAGGESFAEARARRNRMTRNLDPL
jgi:hypothetical protein